MGAVIASALAGLVVAEWGEIPIELSEKLSVKKFRGRYVQKQKPVIIREPLNTPNWTLVDFKKMCGAGPITRYNIMPAMNGWAGLGEGFPMELEAMVDDLERSNSPFHYGMGFDLKCRCPPFTEITTMLPYFEEDRHRHNEFHKTRYPEMMAGLRGSRTELHADKAMLPMWLKLVDGEIDARVVTLSEWRAKLSGDDPETDPIVGDPFPSLRVPFSIYDDALVEKEWIQARNVTVLKGRLLPGDWLYVPVGAFHGENNVGSYPTVAMSANFWDKSHKKQILQNFCDPFVKTREGSPLKAKTMGSRGFGTGAEQGHTASGFVCLDVAGVTADTNDYFKKPASKSVNDIEFSADAVCKSTSRASETCPAADSRCPDRPPPDKGAKLQAGDLDLGGDGDVSRQELALFVAQAAAYYEALPPDASYDDLKTWVQAELMHIWPPGGPQMTNFALDRAIKSRLSSWTNAKDL